MWGYSFLFFTLPLLYFTPLQNPYEFPKFIFFVIVIQIIFLLTSYKFIKHKKSFIHIFDPVTICVLLFGVILFVADISGIDPKISLIGSMYRHQGFILLLSCILLFLTTQTLTTVQRAKIFQSITVSVFFVCLIALIQGPLYQGRIMGTLGNPNSLSGYIIMVLPLILWNQKQIGIKIFLGLLIFLVITLTQSRGAMIAATIVLVLYIFHLSRKIYHTYRYILIGCILLFSLGSIFYMRTYHNERTSIWDNRSIIWQEGLEAVGERPILGYGQENFELIFPPELKMKVDNAHNIFLEIAVSSGLVGLTIFLIIISIAFYKANYMIKTCLIAFLIVAQFNPLSIPQIALFWLLLGSVGKNRLQESRD